MSELQFIPYAFEPEPIVWLQQLLGPGWPLPWRIVSLFGASWGVILAVGLALWLWDRRVAYALLAVIAATGGARMLVNEMVQVPRPSAPDIVTYERIDVGAFPSGHVSTAAALWGYLALRGLVPWLLTLVLVLLVGIGRVYLGVHYPADILGGILLAALVIGGVRKLWPPVRGWLAERAFGFYVAVSLVLLASVFAAAFLYFGGNPYRWRVGGMIAGLAIGLPLEHRFVRFRSGPASGGRTVAKALIGIAGIAAFAAVDQVSGGRSGILGLASTLFAALGAVLVAPTIFSELGWSAGQGVRRAGAVDDIVKGIAIVVGLLAAAVGYGAGIEPRLFLDTEEHVVEMPNLPEAWHGATIATVSDFQSGLWLHNAAMMRRAIADIVDRRPAIVLLAGDFLYDPGGDPVPEVRQVVHALRPLARAGIPTFAVLGNHDWGLERSLPDAEPNRVAVRVLRDSLQAAGIEVLHNRAAGVPARGGGESLYVVGIGSHYARADEPQRALQRVPEEAPRVVFMHHPDSFANVPAGAAPLALAGHTHGGQVRIPLTPAWSWLTFVMEDTVHADGWIEGFGAAGNRLYVTRGIGMSLLPLRINCPPEVTYTTLQAGGDGPRVGGGGGRAPNVESTALETPRSSP